MKIRDVPQSGHLGTFISYRTRYGQFRRPYVIPKDPQTPAQRRHRENMGRPAPWGYVGGFPPDVIQLVCETTFEIVAGRVHGYQLRGNACG